MAAKGNESITSYFKPTGDAKSKSKAATITHIEEFEAHPTTKSTGKRPLSASAPGPEAKRLDTTSISDKHPRHLAYTDLPSNWPKDATQSSTDTPPRSVELSYHKGDIFAAPKNCLLIHACNTQGHWGAGIAKAFKTKYPKAYLTHNTFCAKQHNPKTNPVPTGSAQLLAPVDSGIEHWIGCVFTSAKYGKAKDKPDQILINTGKSVEMLLELVKRANEEGEGVEVIRMCKINSGKFGVPWEKTEEVLRGVVMREGWMGRIEVWEPEE